VAAIWVSGIIALVSLIYTGIEFIISGESSDKRVAAKDRLTKVLWGLAILLISVVVLNFINPDITRLQDPYLLAVQEGVSTEPGIPSTPKDATGVFSCGWDEENEKCIVAEESCGSGKIPDPDWCDNVRYSECVDPKISNNVPCIDPPPQCSDKIDNDADGLIDYPDDKGCESDDDDDETDAPIPPRTFEQCFDDCIASLRDDLYCYRLCSGTFITCDPAVNGYDYCLKTEFNVVVTGTSSTNFRKQAWDSYVRASTGNRGWKRLLTSTGNTLYLKYMSTLPTGSCRGLAANSNTIEFRGSYCLTMTTPNSTLLFIHETAHIQQQRNAYVFNNYAAANLYASDPGCFAFSRKTKPPCSSSASGYFLKTYSLRYYCPSCISINHTRESFAESVAVYLLNSKTTGLSSCANPIYNFAGECPSSANWVQNNIYYR
jgi:hypothetical protein